MKPSTFIKLFGTSHLVLGLLLTAVSEVGAQNYQYRRIGPAGARITQPTDINNAGTIIGQYSPQAGPVVRFVKPRHGDFVPFTIPGARSASLKSINSRGTVTGILTAADGSRRAYIAKSDASACRALPLIDGLVPNPGAITDQEMVIANISTPAISRGAVIDTRHDDAVTYVDYPDSATPFTTLVSGNNRGFVLGSARDEDFTEFVYFSGRPGGFNGFEFPAGQIGGNITDLNDQGDVLAFYITAADGKFHPYIQNPNGNVTELEFPGLAAMMALEAPATFVQGGTTFYRAEGATAMFPVGMNDRGDVVGYIGNGYSDVPNPFPLDPEEPRMFWRILGNGFLAEKIGN